MNKQEKIVCAAIKVEWVDLLSLKYTEVICGVDHNIIRRTGLYQNIKHSPDNNGFKSEKGFITSKNRFVDPKEAEIIAGLSGQIWIDSKRHNLSSIQFEKSLKAMKESGLDSIKIRFPSSDGYYFINHIIGNGLKPEDLY